MRIGIAGVGGIGSNVALNLVRSGIRNLKIVDFDRVEPSNLNRQFYFTDQVGNFKVDMLAINLARLNSKVQITCSNECITSSNIHKIFENCEIIVEGFDGSSDKKMVLEQLGSSKSLIVSASGIAGCLLDSISCKQFGRSFIVGDFISDCQELPLYAHKVVAVAAKMTEIILNHGFLNEYQ